MYIFIELLTGENAIQLLTNCALYQYVISLVCTESTVICKCIAKKQLACSQDCYVTSIYWVAGHFLVFPAHFISISANTYHLLPQSFHIYVILKAAINQFTCLIKVSYFGQITNLDALLFLWIVIVNIKYIPLTSINTISRLCCTRI